MRSNISEGDEREKTGRRINIKCEDVLKETKNRVRVGGELRKNSGLKEGLEGGARICLRFC